jgi:hypothetical protein
MKATPSIERQRSRIAEQIKDREDYRDTLIERQESTERKIALVHEQIGKLRASLRPLKGSA